MTRPGPLLIEALDGAVGSLPMTLIDYIPGYRSRPSTGCAMGFAYWQ
jgi:hypothetical protein